MKSTAVALLKECPPKIHKLSLKTADILLYSLKFYPWPRRYPPASQECGIFTRLETLFDFTGEHFIANTYLCKHKATNYILPDLRIHYILAFLFFSEHRVASSPSSSLLNPVTCCIPGHNNLSNVIVVDQSNSIPSESQILPQKWHTYIQTTLCHGSISLVNIGYFEHVLELACVCQRNKTQHFQRSQFCWNLS